MSVSSRARSPSIWRWVAVCGVSTRWRWSLTRPARRCSTCSVSVTCAVRRGRSRRRSAFFERGENMVLAENRTTVGGRLGAVTVEAVPYTRPSRVDFRVTRGPVPHVVEQFELTTEGDRTVLEYTGELGTDLWALGSWWGNRVAPMGARGRAHVRRGPGRGRTPPGPDRTAKPRSLTRIPDAGPRLSAARSSKGLRPLARGRTGLLERYRVGSAALRALTGVRMSGARRRTALLRRSGRSPVPDRLGLQQPVADAPVPAQSGAACHANPSGSVNGATSLPSSALTPDTNRDHYRSVT